MIKKIKYTKSNESGIIDLADGYKLIVPRFSDDLQLMVAIGMLVQMYILVSKDHKRTYEQVKECLNDYLDTIYEKVI